MVGIPPGPFGTTPVGVFHSHRYSNTFTPSHGTFPGDVEPNRNNYLFAPDCSGIIFWDFAKNKEVDLIMNDLKAQAKACRKR